MNQLLDLAFALLTAPERALRQVTNEERLKEGFILWLFVVFLLSLSVFRQGPGPVVQFLMLFLFMGAALLVHSAVIDYISGLWGGMGTARGLRRASWQRPCLWLSPWCFRSSIILVFLSSPASAASSYSSGPFIWM